MASRKFAVPAGCRDAMTDLHNAHEDRYNKIKTRLKKMKDNEIEDHKLIGAFMDTHHVLHGAVERLLKHSSSKRIPNHLHTDLTAAAIHAGDVHSSLVYGRRGPGVGRARLPDGTPYGRKMANQFKAPQDALKDITDGIKIRYGKK